MEIKTPKYSEVYGNENSKVYKTALGEPTKYNNGAVVERFSIKRVGAQKPYCSVKTVVLPEDSPLRKLNIDKFELTKAKISSAWCDEIEKGLSKNLKIYNINGDILFEGIPEIKKFMKSISHLIRK